MLRSLKTWLAATALTVLAACTVVLGDDPPTLEYDVDFRELSPQFEVGSGVFGTPRIKFNTYMGTNLWSANGYTWTFRFGTNENAGTMSTITGTPYTNYVLFTVGTNDFSAVCDHWYAAVLGKSNTFTYPYAQGWLTLRKAPEVQATGTLSMTRAINGSSFGPFTGDFSGWPFVITNATFSSTSLASVVYVDARDTYLTALMGTNIGLATNSVVTNYLYRATNQILSDAKAFVNSSNAVALSLAQVATNMASNAMYRVGVVEGLTGGWNSAWTVSTNTTNNLYSWTSRWNTAYSQVTNMTGIVYVVAARTSFWNTAYTNSTNLTWRMNAIEALTSAWNAVSDFSGIYSLTSTWNTAYANSTNAMAFVNAAAAITSVWNAAYAQSGTSLTKLATIEANTNDYAAAKRFTDNILNSTQGWNTAYTYAYAISLNTNTYQLAYTLATDSTNRMVKVEAQTSTINTAYSTATNALTKGTNALAIANSGFANATNALVIATNALVFGTNGYTIATNALVFGTNGYTIATNAYKFATNAYTISTNAYVIATNARVSQIDTLTWTLATPFTNWGPYIGTTSTITRLMSQVFAGASTASVFRKYYTNSWSTGTLITNIPVVSTSTLWAVSLGIPPSNNVGVYFAGGVTQNCVMCVEVTR